MDFLEVLVFEFFPKIWTYLASEADMAILWLTHIKLPSLDMFTSFLAGNDYDKF